MSYSLVLIQAINLILKYQLMYGIVDANIDSLLLPRVIINEHVVAFLLKMNGLDDLIT